MLGVRLSIYDGMAVDDPLGAPNTVERSTVGDFRSTRLAAR